MLKTTNELLDRIKELERVNEQYREENGRLREAVRKQGEFIQDMKKRIRDFREHPPVSLGRAIADRGLRDVGF